MTKHVSFAWRKLWVEADWHVGTTPAGGPDPSELAVESISVGDERLPDWLEEYVAEKYYSELCDEADAMECGGDDV